MLTISRSKRALAGATTDTGDDVLAGKSQFALFRSRYFMPLFLTQFLGGFNDNFFKSAMVILITYRLADLAHLDARILITAAAGVFIFPYFAFSSLAGQLADKYERSGLVRKIKIAEIAIMSGAVAGFQTGSIALLMTVLFLAGVQAAFFSPLKYSILPQHLQKDELIGGNALIETGTFLAILTGTIAGGLSVLGEGGEHRVSLLVEVIAVAGYWASRYIPPTRPIDPALQFRYNVLKETIAIVRDVMPRRDVFTAVIGGSWFWFVGATFLSQFPTYAKEVLGADATVATLFLAIFSVGIGAGSLACNGLLKNEISGRYVPWAAIGMAAASVLLYLASLREPPHSAVVIDVAAFLSSPLNLAVLACLFAISFFGGLYIVPLYAIIQSRTEENRMARVTACGNVSDSFFMVTSSVGTTILLELGLSIPQIFLVTALLTVLAAAIIRGAVHERMERREGG